MHSLSKAVHDQHDSQESAPKDRATAFATRPQRFHELDSLRGLAACTVVLGHFASGVSAAFALSLWHSPLRFLVTGHDAVILFFVLSGFVLFLPYERREGLSYFKFLVKRTCRIYLPYLGALMLAVAMNIHYHGLVTDHEWVRSTWNQAPNVHLVIQHILFLGNYRWEAFNTAFWSLVYEMRISLLFPFLAIAVLRFRNQWMLVFAVFSSWLSAHYYLLVRLSGLHPLGLQSLDTLHYMSFFILGAMLAKNREFIRAQYRRLPLIFVFFLSLFAILLYYHPFDIPVARAAILPVQKIQDWSVAFGSLVAITLAIYSGPFRNLLNHHAIRYLGRISYSVYLVHATVLFTLIYICRGHLTFSYFPIYLIAVLGLASVFHYVIERPSMTLGQTLVKVSWGSRRF
ncbi:MAG: acyltransferase, partial [Terracidiphilus sp.]